MYPHLRTEWLLHFVQLVKTGSYEQAAAQLDVSISSVRNNLRQLEKKLDTQLLDRQQGVLVPTLSGRTFYSQAHEYLDLLNQLQSNLSYFQRPSMDGPQTISVGCTGKWAMSWVDRALQSVYQKQSHFNLKLFQVTPYVRTEARLMLDQLDILLTPFALTSPGLRCQPLGPEMPFLIVSQPQPQRPWYAFEWADLEWLQHESYAGYQTRSTSWWNDKKYPRKIRFRSDSVSAILSVCEQFGYAACLPECLVTDSIKAGLLGIVCEPPEPLCFQPYLIWAPDKIQTDLQKQFLSVLQEFASHV